MGRNTWESLPKKPLPNRFNAVITNTLSMNSNNIKTFKSFEDVLQFSREKSFSDVWIMGGEQIYNSALKIDIVDEIHATIIDDEYDCDTFFQIF